MPRRFLLLLRPGDSDYPFRRARLWLVFLPVIAACSSSQQVATYSVRDSAGVMIAENSGLGWTTDDAWHLSASPAVQIGVVEGDESYQLNGVTNAFRLTDGRIVIANGGTQELRFFDARGKYLHTIGGRGGGPGEFRYMASSSHTAGDTLLAWNIFSGVMRFRPSGTYLGQTRLELATLFEPPFFSEGGDLLPDGSLLLQLYEGGAGPPQGLYRPKTGFVRLTPSTGEQDTLGWYGGNENFIVSINGRTIANGAPFGRRTVTASNDRRVYIGDTERYEIRVFDFAGRLEMLIRRDAEPVAVTPDDISAFERLYHEFMTRIPEGRQTEFERWLNEVAYPDTKPAFRGLAGDLAGNLWVEETASSPDDAGRWSIFGPDGRLLGQLTTPNGLSILEIGSDYVLARWRDDIDVEYVRSYDLIKP